jgi:hypothetical protein
MVVIDDDEQRKGTGFILKLRKDDHGLQLESKCRHGGGGHPRPLLGIQGEAAGKGGVDVWNPK